MTIHIHNITLKNFLSVGNVCQTIQFGEKNLTLILGDNLDLGSNGARNGVGKTVIAQALSYALYGEPINKIKVDNLINRTNLKNMMVTIDFSIDQNNYRIERGRKPNVLRFYVNDIEQNESQGENKETQHIIVSLLKMTHTMFKHLVVLNTYTEPFLSMKAADQREIIEQLLGISLLSEKADLIKEKIKDTKMLIQKEEFKIKAVEESNKRVSEQIDNLKKRQMLWKKKYDEDLNAIIKDYETLSNIDFETELINHTKLTEYNAKVEKKKKYDEILKKENAWKTNIDSEINTIKKKLEVLNQIDISTELLNHNLCEDHDRLVKEHKTHTESINTTLNSFKLLKNDIARVEKDITILKEHKCHSCGQELHDSKHEELLKSKSKSLEEMNTKLAELNDSLESLSNKLVVVPDSKPTLIYKTKNEALLHFTQIEKLEESLKDKSNQVSPYSDMLVENTVILDDEKPVTIYATESEAIKNYSKMEMLQTQLETKLSENVDPYHDQILDMEKNALGKISYDTINDLTRLHEHQKFLVDLLTNKDSFVRKKIIDKNLTYLNNRLKHYLQSIGLPHSVTFKNDLSVEISELGRDLDFANLSRGEGNRLIISLSLSFRDVYESMFNNINLMIVDELMDSGMDTIGTDNGLALLKDLTRNRNKSVLLISHKDELINRVDSVLRVVKQNGFTEYNLD